jgi:hypothetical protein
MSRRRRRVSVLDRLFVTDVADTGVDRALLRLARRLPYRRARGVRRLVDDRRLGRAMTERALLVEALRDASSRPPAPVSKRWVPMDHTETVDRLLALHRPKEPR